MNSRFRRLSACGLALALAIGVVYADDEKQGDAKKKRETAEKAETVWEYLAELYDKDKDGKVSRKEYTRDDEHWKRLDKDGDGFVIQSEVESGGRRGGMRRGGMRGEGRDGGREAAPEPPKVGQKAPLFELDVLARDDKPNKKKEKKPKPVKLADYKGKKPVALIFGSYT